MAQVMETQVRFRAGGDIYQQWNEAADGLYYVTSTGQTLHVDERCFYLRTSCVGIADPTCTLMYRLLCGDVLFAPRPETLGQQIVDPCLVCVVNRYPGQRSPLVTRLRAAWVRS